MGKSWKQMVAVTTIAATVGMMYPKYCFADGTYRIIIEEHGNYQEIIVPQGETDLYGLLHADADQIEIKSKLLEYIASCLN